MKILGKMKVLEITEEICQQESQILTFLSKQPLNLSSFCMLSAVILNFEGAKKLLSEKSCKEIATKLASLVGWACR